MDELNIEVGVRWEISPHPRYFNHCLEDTPHIHRGALAWISHIVGVPEIYNHPRLVARSEAAQTTLRLLTVTVTLG